MLYLRNISETFQDFPDNESLAVIAFFYGCSHYCKNCQNKDLQLYQEGLTPYSLQEVYEAIISSCERSHTKSIVLSGGDPYCDLIPGVQEDMLALISTLENEGYEVCVYTGYDIDYVNSLYNPLFYYTSSRSSNPPMPVFWKKPSYVKCGEYKEDLRDEKMGKYEKEFILASKNQRFYCREEDNFIPMSNSNVIEL